MDHPVGSSLCTRLLTTCVFVVLFVVCDINAQQQNATQQNRTQPNCSVVVADTKFAGTISELLKDSKEITKNLESMKIPAYLIKYTMDFPRRKNKTNPLKTNLNPLKKNLKYYYEPNIFMRASNRHGLTLLLLAFHYGVFSLTTLELGVFQYNVSLNEEPDRCLDGLNESQTINVILFLMARDFNLSNTKATIEGDERICVKDIENKTGFAVFGVKCYDGDTVASLKSKKELENKWAAGLYILIGVIKIIIFCFGPLVLTAFVARLSNQSAPYIVRLKEPLIRSLFVSKTLEDFQKARGRRILDLKKCRGFAKLKQTLLTCPMGVPFMAEISEYDILAASKRLIKENEIPVTFWSTIAEAVFSCKMKDASAMKSCCSADMFKSVPFVKKEVRWVTCCYHVGNLLLIILLPFLYYLRLLLYYLFEDKEIKLRNQAAQSLGLREEFDNSLILYFRPTHGLFIGIYAVYFFSALMLGFLTYNDDDDRFRNILVGSFADLNNLSYTDVISMMIGNVLWPFKRFGIFGIVVAPGYWVVIMPITTIVTVFYCLPAVYLIIRMLFYSRKAFLETIRTYSGVRKYQTRLKLDNTVQIFKTEYVLGDAEQSQKKSSGDHDFDELEKFKTSKLSKSDDDRQSVASSIIHIIRVRPWRFFQHILSSIVCIVSMVALLIIISECLGSIAEIAIFTMIGVVANASAAVKYTALAIMVIIYSYSCFNSVKRKYLALNATLFPELKKRIKNLLDVTGLPSYAQENEAFKSQEQSEQGEHEIPDDIAERPARHWLINDLVLFVDNEDTFRIPRRLFKAVTEIRVAGVPGPVSMGMLRALFSFFQLLVFLLFVLIAIQCFGTVYKMSNMTQTMAIVGSGLIPLLLEYLKKGGSPDIVVNTLSFTSKLDEVIKAFWQIWPIHDFSFKVTTSANPTFEKVYLAKISLDTKAGSKGSKASKYSATRAGSKAPTDSATVADSKASKGSDTRPSLTTSADLETGTATVAGPEAPTDSATMAGLTDPTVPETLPSPKASAVLENTTPPDQEALDTIEKPAAAPKKPRPKIKRAKTKRPNLAPPPIKDDARQSNTNNQASAADNPLDQDLEGNRLSVFLVDLLIRLPSRYEDTWVDGWSNIVDIEEVRQETRASEVEDIMAAESPQAVQPNIMPEEAHDFTV